MQGKVLQTDKNAHRIVAFPAFDAGGKLPWAVNARQGALSCIVVILSNAYQCMSDKND